jgi:hypothetical protein
MHDTDLHLLSGADEISWDVLVAGQYCACCYWRSLIACVAYTVVQTVTLFLCLFLKVGSLSFLFAEILSDLKSL